MCNCTRSVHLQQPPPQVPDPSSSPLSRPSHVKSSFTSTSYDRQCSNRNFLPLVYFPPQQHLFYSISIRPISNKTSLQKLCSPHKLPFFQTASRPLNHPQPILLIYPRTPPLPCRSEWICLQQTPLHLRDPPSPTSRPLMHTSSTPQPYQPTPTLPSYLPSLISHPSFPAPTPLSPPHLTASTNPFSIHPSKSLSSTAIPPLSTKPLLHLSPRKKKTNLLLRHPCRFTHSSLIIRNTPPPAVPTSQTSST